MEYGHLERGDGAIAVLESEWEDSEKRWLSESGTLKARGFQAHGFSQKAREPHQAREASKSCKKRVDLQSEATLGVV